MQQGQLSQEEYTQKAESLELLEVAYESTLKSVEWYSKKEMVSSNVLIPKDIQIDEGRMDTPFGGYIDVQDLRMSKYIRFYGPSICAFIPTDEPVGSPVLRKAIVSLLNSLSFD